MGVFIAFFTFYSLNLQKKISNGWYNTKAEYLGETKEEAIRAIMDAYNDKNQLVTPSESANREFMFFSIGRGANKVDLVGEIIKIDGKVYTLQDNRGNTYEKVIANKRQILTATEADFMKEVEFKKPLPKYAIGDKIKTVDGREHTIEDIDFQQTYKDLFDDLNY